MPIKYGIRDPESPKDWQAAVNMAKWCLSFAACGRFGLQTGLPPGVHIQRCKEILEKGRQRGIVPGGDLLINAKTRKRKR